jgi:hypothetical protein
VTVAGEGGRTQTLFFCVQLCLFCACTARPQHLHSRQYCTAVACSCVLVAAPDLTAGSTVQLLRWGHHSRGQPPPQHWQLNSRSAAVEGSASHPRYITQPASQPTGTCLDTVGVCSCQGDNHRNSISTSSMQRQEGPLGGRLHAQCVAFLLLRVLAAAAACAAVVPDLPFACFPPKRRSGASRCTTGLTCAAPDPTVASLQRLTSRTSALLLGTSAKMLSGCHAPALHLRCVCHACCDEHGGGSCSSRTALTGRTEATTHRSST